MNFEKDYSALIAAAWDLDSAYEKYLSDPEGTPDEICRMLGENDNSTTTKTKLVDRILASKPTNGSFRDRYVDPFIQKG